MKELFSRGRKYDTYQPTIPQEKQQQIKRLCEELQLSCWQLLFDGSARKITDNLKTPYIQRLLHYANTNGDDTPVTPFTYREMLH